MKKPIPALLVGIVLAMAQTAPGQILLQTKNLRLEIGDNAVVRSLRAEPSNRELLARPGTEPLARVYRGGQWVYQTVRLLTGGA